MQFQGSIVVHNPTPGASVLAIMGKAISLEILGHATGESQVSDWVGSVSDLAELWPALVSGRARIVEIGATEAHYYLRFEVAISRAGTPVNQRYIQVLERLLLGDAPKAIAIDERCSASTVATAVHESLRAMGLRSGRIPALLVVMMHALRGKPGHARVRVESTADRDGVRHWVTCARPELQLKQRLTVAELEVLALLVEGKCHQEIALRRQTARRTVANQLASVYRKLGVSGRLDLLHYLASRAGETSLSSVLAEC